ncbi:MAG TPA: DsrH/TusB family sulfur metabolism protein [Candidatus Desulfaltia sp.]|nr:DsrH/TusB family sulfur metabolism protein [Candidatus Desulfaltia sp.]
MSKLVLLKGLDENALRAALSIEGSAIVLLQDAVYMARESQQVKEALNEHTIYVLGGDAAKRGLPPESLEGLLILGYDELVDLMFSGVEVINL